MLAISGRLRLKLILIHVTHFDFEFQILTIQVQFCIYNQVKDDSQAMLYA